MWNKSESARKTICQWVSLQDRIFTMHLRQNSQQISLKCIVKNLSWSETHWQMVFLTDSDLFHIIVTRKSSFSFGLFGLGKKYQGRTVRLKDIVPALRIYQVKKQIHIKLRSNKWFSLIANIKSVQHKWFSIENNHSLIWELFSTFICFPSKGSLCANLVVCAENINVARMFFIGSALKSISSKWPEKEKKRECFILKIL